MEFRCKAFLFDLDGVLVDSRAVVERTWRRWAQRHQLDPDLLLQIAHGRRTRDTLEAATPDLALDSEVAWLDAVELTDTNGLRVVPGAKQLVSALPADRWAVVTSCGRALAQLRLESVGLPVPDVLVVSEGYDAAACIVFEDAPAGVAAGRAAGARVLGVTTTHSAADLPDTEVTIPDFTDIHVRADRDTFVLSISAPQLRRNPLGRCDLNE